MIYYLYTHTINFHCTNIDPYMKIIYYSGNHLYWDHLCPCAKASSAAQCCCTRRWTINMLLLSLWLFVLLLLLLSLLLLLLLCVLLLLSITINITFSICFVFSIFCMFSIYFQDMYLVCFEFSIVHMCIPLYILRFRTPYRPSSSWRGRTGRTCARRCSLRRETRNKTHATYNIINQYTRAIHTNNNILCYCYY